NTVLLTKDIASKYFGDWRTAMGNTFKIDGLNVKVTGILNNLPPNTDFPINAVLSYSTMANYANMNSWGNINDDNYCFIQLANDNSPSQFQTLLDRFVDKHIKPVNP